MDYRELCVAAGLIGEDEHEFQPDADDLFGFLENLGMFRLTCTLPVLASGTYEFEASFPAPGTEKGWKLLYGTGPTREIALVRLYMGLQRGESL